LLNDNKFLRAVEDRLTIQQAMEAGLLDPGTTVGQPDDFTGLLSFPNIKKLRRARIFSLGLEIAAQKIFDKDPSLDKASYTLKEIIDGFSQFSSTGYCSDTININGDFKDKDNNDTPDGWSFNRVCGSGAILNNNEVTLRTTDGAEYAAIRRILSTRKGETYTLTFEYDYQQPDQDPPVSIIFYCPIGHEDCQVSTWRGVDHPGFQFTSSNGWTSGKITFEATYDNEYMRIVVSYGICLDEGANPISCSGGKGCQDSNFGQPYSQDAILKLRNIKLLRGEFTGDYKPASPFCHLVDPNWVLKASTYQCETIGYSAVPVPDSTQRQETCVDLKDCINEKEDGTCDTWAYCTREKNIWRFSGETCEEQYASCQTYTRLKDGKQAFYLASTIEAGTCDQNNSGCQWYCTNWNYVNGTWVCQQPDQGQSIFFNSKVEQCSEKEEGCREYIRIAPGLGTNLIPNSSFETYTGSVGGIQSVTEWSIDGGQFVIDGSNSKTGQVTARIDSQDGGPKYFNISLLPWSDYTFSVWVKNTDSQPHTIALFGNNFASATPALYQKEISARSDYQKVSFTFNTNDYKNPLTSRDLRWEVSDNTAFESGKYVYFDDLQMETGILVSEYKEYGSVNKIYLQKAEACEDEDVGCQLYTPVNGEDIAISGLVGSKDICPSACAGYETFKEMSTNLEATSRLVNFIPETGQTCSVPGCEEFTNLDEVAQGGEGIENYSYLRQCVKLPDEAGSCGNFFTWVGSETTGYQLKKYQLKKDDHGDPERVLSYQGAKRIWGDCEDLKDALINPNCKQFFNEAGEVSYHLYKNTITCSQDCHPYRRSLDKQIYMAIPSEGESCSAQEVSCREYKGPTANNIRQVFKNDFENGTINPWTNGELSNESIIFPGHSMSVKVKTGQLLDTFVEDTSRSVAGLVDKNKVYFLSFWIQGINLDNLDLVKVKFSSSNEQVRNINNSEEWQEIKLGPFYLNASRDNEMLKINANSDFYIDNIILKEAQDDIYLIKDSWFTPNVCDQDLTGALIPGYAIGCQLYNDQDDNPHYLKSFTGLCSDQAVGCEAFIDTQNSDSPFEQKFNTEGDTDTVELEDFKISLNGSTLGPNSDTVTVGADTMVYLINDESKSCKIQDQGCQKMGLPILNSAGQIDSWKDIYLRNDPDLYTQRPILCTYQDLSCESYANETYFKDPELQGKLCEYTSKFVDGESKTGWFKKGTDQPEACYSNTDYGIRTSEDRRYEGRVGLCPISQTSCTEFMDPGSGRNIENLIRFGDFSDKQAGEVGKDPTGWENNFEDRFGPGNWSIEVVSTLPVNRCVGGENTGELCGNTSDCLSYTCNVNNNYNCQGQAGACAAPGYCDANSQNSGQFCEFPRTCQTPICSITGQACASYTSCTYDAYCESGPNAGSECRP
ncbi:hypothetical protein IID20_04170, partial [Patescibacteria group bacterium]|nr:hypothetical protein [Patescibacteria group bacterium]